MNSHEFQRYYREIVNISLQYTNKHHVVRPDEVGREIHARKNALLYRCYSVQWHWYLASCFVSETAILAKKPENRGELPFFVRNRTEQVSFYFDDVVFNLVSMFDYLATLIGLVIKGDRFRWVKWNSLAKHFRQGGLSFPETKTLFFEVHNSLVNKLAEYRSGLYHQEPDYGSAQFTDDYFSEAVDVRMFVPERAVKLLKCFNSGKKYELVTGTEILIDCAFHSQFMLLSQAYNEKT